ncbi:MAG: hypothetical protein EZS28_008221 [Streblomastix strix]|uniref:Uncharacterized protein n=1 Tax=Streblomastix strix TaxID=222440 RepID=A0A5J4WMP1_9EUKA|nr:MAG: hypothetical protein EZS28_008221 [Streblomastix strix]
MNGDEEAYKQLVQAGYSTVVMTHISTAGGICKEKQNDINYELQFLGGFINNLHKGRSFIPILLPAPSDLIKTNSEQIEEQGGLEEIEAQLTNNKGDINYIKFDASKAKNSILNYFNYPTNEQRWF